MARRRRRRVGESVDGAEDSILDGDEDDDLDIRVTTLEEGLQKVVLDTQEAQRDARATRARLEKMVREAEEEAEADDELFQEIDQLKQSTASNIEGLSAATAEITERVAEITARLDDVASSGPLEELPQRLEELVQQLHQQTQTRFAALEATYAEENELAAARAEELANHMETQLEPLRDSSRLEQLAADSQQKFETLTNELDVSLNELSDTLRAGLADTNAGQAALKSELEATMAELADALDSRAGNDEVAQLRAEVQQLSETLALGSDVGERALSATARVEQLEALLSENAARFETLAARSRELAAETEGFSDKVDLAVRLVRSLDDRGRGGSGSVEVAPAGASSVGDGDLEAPDKTDLGFGLRDLLNVMASNQASDLHLKVGAMPTVRLHGELVPVGNHTLGEEDCRRLIFSALSKEERRRLLQARTLDFLFELPGMRLRGSAFFQRNRLCASLRMLRSQMPTLEELALPVTLRRTVATLKHGLILVAGPLGAGKSTTIAALVDELNRNRKLHIMTLEAPVSYVHTDSQSLITQREQGLDYTDLSKALHDSLKQDPDVLVIDPLAGDDALSGAMAAADSGHLVIASMEAPNLLSALDRAFSLCASQPHLCDRRLLAQNLKAVVSQRLLPRSDKSKGLVPAAELLVVNPAISALLGEGQMNALSQAVANGQAGEGSQTMAQSLSRLVETGVIGEAEAATLLPSSSAAAVADAGPAPAGAAPAAPGESDDPIMRWL